MDPRKVRRSLDAHSAARSGLDARVRASVLRSVRGFDGWYDHSAITAWTAQVVRVVEAGQRSTALITDAYLSQVSREVMGRAALPVGPIDPSRLRAGVTHQGAYGRLADQYRFEVSKGGDTAGILDGVLARAGAMVGADLQLAFTHQVSRFSEARGWDLWRRVIRPETSKGGVCGLCVAASDRYYNRGDLMPMHSNCNCGVLPVSGDDDPGRSLNEDELGRLYDDAGSTRARDLIRTKYRVDENGELGPVLVPG